jgi:hypothetical protein
MPEAADKQMKTNYSWEPVYAAAFLETNDAELPRRIAEARKILNARFRQLVLEGGHPEERQAVDHALHALAVLKTEGTHPAEPGKS